MPNDVRFARTSLHKCVDNPPLPDAALSVFPSTLVLRDVCFCETSPPFIFSFESVHLLYIWLYVHIHTLSRKSVTQDRFNAQSSLALTRNLCDLREKAGLNFKLKNAAKGSFEIERG